MLPYFPDYKPHIKALNWLKNQRCASCGCVYQPRYEAAQLNGVFIRLVE